MVKSLISWVVFGVISYGWYWVGFVWPHLQTAEWEPVWLLITVVAILIQRRNGVAAVGANVIETVINRVQGIVGSLIGLLVANVVGVTVNSIVVGAFVMQGYIDGAIVILSCALLTSAWLGAMDDATQ